MNVLPIMTRELRVQARRAATFGLRVAGVLAAVVVFFVLCFGRALPAAEVGGRLFMSLHGVTLIFIWLAVPLLTADSIARERREGTFGLLFLTPLSPIDVLLGKLLVHFLAAMTLWVSILPVMIIPFVLGGVAAMDVISAVVLQGISIVLSLVAGLLASVWVKDLRWATALSVIFGAIFLVVLIESVKSELVRNGLPAGKSGRVWVATGRLTPIVMQNGVTGWAQGGVSLAAGADGLFWVGLTNWEATWAPNLGTWVGPGRSWRDSLRRLALLSAGMAMVVVAGCAARVRRLSRDQASSQREIWLYEKFCRPTVWVDLFQHRMSGSLNRNPIGWLHVRSVAGRLTMWIWVGVVTVLETYTVAAGWEIASSLQAFVGILLLIGMAYSSADSFRDERQSGALELILVTPIREGAILWGRLQGIWMQFLPAVAAFILAEIFFP